MACYSLKRSSRRADTPHPRSLWIAIAWLLVAAGSLAPMRDGERAQAATSPEAAAIHPGSVRLFEDADGPKARLNDGREYPLLPMSDAEKQRAIDQARRARATVHIQAAPTGPGHVDNRRFHGPIRDQGERGTCISFAAAAALEGMYRRLDPVRFSGLELSPQYLNYFQKMVERAPTTKAAQMEDQWGCWGGSFVQYVTRVMVRYGVAEEAAMPYNPTAAYEQMGKGDTLQAQADAFNLGPANLPIGVLEHAPYRPASIDAVQFFTDDQTRDTSNLERWVAAGYDVLFGLTLVDDGRTGATELNGDGAWVPGDGQPVGGHAMLIVGYDRPHRYFIVRNQWGTGPGADANDGGYTDVSYDYIHQYAHEGTVITAVADPQQGTTDRLWIRSWKSAPDGSRFDIYRLPGTYSHKDPRANDYRVGTRFAADGTAYRVNGYFYGEDLVISWDPKDPNMQPDALSGNWAVLQLNADHNGIQVISQGVWRTPVVSGGGQGAAPGTQDCGVGGPC